MATIPKSIKQLPNSPPRSVTTPILKSTEQLPNSPPRSVSTPKLESTDLTKRNSECQTDLNLVPSVPAANVECQTSLEQTQETKDSATNTSNECLKEIIGTTGTPVHRNVSFSPLPCNYKSVNRPVSSNAVYDYIKPEAPLLKTVSYSTLPSPKKPKDIVYHYPQITVIPDEEPLKDLNKNFKLEFDKFDKPNPFKKEFGFNTPDTPSDDFFNENKFRNLSPNSETITKIEVVKITPEFTEVMSKRSKSVNEKDETTETFIEKTKTKSDSNADRTYYFEEKTENLTTRMDFNKNVGDDSKPPPINFATLPARTSLNADILKSPLNTNRVFQEEFEKEYSFSEETFSFKTNLLHENKNLFSTNNNTKPSNISSMHAVATSTFSTDSNKKVGG